MLIYKHIFDRSNALVENGDQIRTIIEILNGPWLEDRSYNKRAISRTKALRLLQINSANKLQVLTTCRQIYLEARSIAFGETFWDIRLPDVVFSLRDKVPSAIRHRILHVRKLVLRTRSSRLFRALELISAVLGA